MKKKTGNEQITVEARAKISKSVHMNGLLFTSTPFFPFKRNTEKRACLCELNKKFRCSILILYGICYYLWVFILFGCVCDAEKCLQKWTRKKFQQMNCFARFFCTLENVMSFPKFQSNKYRQQAPAEAQPHSNNVSIGGLLNVVRYVPHKCYYIPFFSSSFSFEILKMKKKNQTKWMEKIRWYM